MTTITHAPSLVAGRSLLPDALFTRLSARIRDEHLDLSPGMPERIMDQALAFLAACAVTTEPIGPSEAVDIGWHTFILYTAEYAAFCEQIAGRFIHHIPDDEPERGPDGKAVNCRCQPSAPPPDNQIDREGAAVVSLERASLKTTVVAIRVAGYRVDPVLWPVNEVSDCTQCHAGCHDSPGKS